MGYAALIFCCISVVGQVWDKIVEEIKNGRRPPSVRYDDGDQSPAEDSWTYNKFTAEMLHKMDYSPRMPHMSDWMKHLFNGDYDAIIGILAILSSEETQMLLRQRESMKNRGALYHVIFGAASAILKVDINWLMNHHIKIIKKLLSIGAEVNAKDAHGFSPLMFCIWVSGCEQAVQANCFHVFLQIAKILISAGACVNVKDRRGSTSLLEVTRTKQFQWVKFLIDKGANPFIVDNLNESPFSNASSSRDVGGSLPEALKLFAEYTMTALKEERRQLHRAAGGSLKKCSVCLSRPRQVAKKCTGCFMVYYCSKRCQVRDWDSHKNFCKVSQILLIYS